ncbi:phenylalanine--tRNA ligase subunit beta [Candidatus Saccharibacteria bacterium]|nr:phenylalanine--tRNA ligase subunit beta [Candidatus Saccharibacteria bacterium]
MIISLNWLKKYVDIKIPTEELVELIGARLVEVERVIDLAPKYAGAVVVKVVSAEKIEGSDHLSLCFVDDAGVVKNAQRNDDGTVRVVCGSPNIRGGVQAVWLPPGAVVPETYGRDNQVHMDARKLCGHVSNGMLAGPDELDFGERTDDVVYIDPADAKPGDDFAEIFGLNDTLLDIENKSLTHRPDCFGVIGFAREVAGILGQKFEAPDRLNVTIEHTKQSSLDRHGDELPRDDVNLAVEIIDPKLCPRYQAVVLDGFNDRAAKHLSEAAVVLAKSGMRSIDPIVDVTNYLMLLTGQPLHAFDYDKLVAVGGQKEAKIIIRAAKKGEKMELLDGRNIEMSEDDIVITSNNVPVALAGAMGGANTAIDQNTKRIVIESATFNLYNLRGTQFRHGIFSEAITRFTKGQPPALTDPVIDECVEILTEEHGMKIIGGKVDAYPKKVENPVVDLTLSQINNLLGANFTAEQVKTTLENIGYKIAVIARSETTKQSMDRHATARDDEVQFTAQAPWWRTDIHIPEDVIEDIGRINGFDNITPTLPRRDFAAPTPDKLGDLKSKIRQALASFGANEVLTYSFVSEKLLKKAGQDPKNSYKITNSISPELQYVRQSLVPSLLDKAFENYDEGYDQFALFEMNQVYQKSYGLTNEKVPCLRDKAALVLTNDNNEQTIFYEVKQYAERLFLGLGIRVHFVPLVDDHASNKVFNPKRSAQIKSDLDETICFGVVGEMKNSVKNAFGLLQQVAGFELNLDRILNALPDKTTDRKKRSRYPLAKRDMTFQVNSDLAYIALENLLREGLEKQELWFELAPISIYQSEDKTTKNISFHLTFADYDKTLSGDEIAAIVNGIADAAAEQLGAKII